MAVKSTRSGEANSATAYPLRADHLNDLSDRQKSAISRQLPAASSSNYPRREADIRSINQHNGKVPETDFRGCMTRVRYPPRPPNTWTLPDHPSGKSKGR